MDMIPNVILGISPSTRSLGIAVMRNGDLVDWKTKTFPGKFSKEKVKSIVGVIKEEMEVHRTQVIAMYWLFYKGVKNYQAQS